MNTENWYEQGQPCENEIDLKFYLRTGGWWPTRSRPIPGNAPVYLVAVKDGDRAVVRPAIYKVAVGLDHTHDPGWEYLSEEPVRGLMAWRHLEEPPDMTRPDMP